LADPPRLEITSNGATFVLDGWYNHFDGHHHHELLELVQQLGLESQRDDDSPLPRFRRPQAHGAAETSGANASAQVQDPHLPGAVGVLMKPMANPSTISCGGGANMFDMTRGANRPEWLRVSAT